VRRIETLKLKLHSVNRTIRLCGKTGALEKRDSPNKMGRESFPVITYTKVICVT